MAEFDLVQVGVVESPVSDRRLMSPHGVPAEIRVFPEYEDGLLLIQENSHIWVVGWFDGADRERLQIVRPTYEPSRRRRGVFGVRSTTRPNSLAVTPARLLQVRGTVLSLEALDLVDGTPIVDIKRYSPSFDTIFSARSSRDRYLLDKADPARLVELEAEASHFHGELNADVVIGARLIQFVSLNWNIMPKDDDLRVTIGLDPAVMRLVDAVQSLTAATFGSGRLRAAEGMRFIFEYGEQMLIFEPLPVAGESLEPLRACPFGELFRVLEN